MDEIKRRRTDINENIQLNWVEFDIPSFKWIGEFFAQSIGHFNFKDQ